MKTRMVLLTPMRCAAAPAVLFSVFISAPAWAGGGGSLDVVYANLNQRNRVCVNDGAGSFTCSDVSTDTNASREVALGDVDGANGLDIVFPNLSGQRNRVCLNDGSGSFTCSDVSTDTNSTFGVALGDVDGANGLDIIFANTSGQRNRVCLNDGSGSFTCSDVSTDTNFSTGVALGDVDGANGLDAVFANGGRNRVCMNDGSGSFTCSDVSTDTNGGNGVALGDVDGANGLDAVFVNTGGQRNRVCLNDGSGSFTCGDVSTDTNDGRGMAPLGDVDGVNGLDAVFVNALQVNRVCANNGSGSFTCSDVSTDTNNCPTRKLQLRHFKCSGLVCPAPRSARARAGKLQIGEDVALSVLGTEGSTGIQGNRAGDLVGECSGCSPVLVVQPAEMGNGDDLAGFDRRDFSGYRGVPAEREMGSRAIVVPDVLLHASPKVALAQYDQVVDALPPD